MVSNLLSLMGPRSGGSSLRVGSGPANLPGMPPLGGQGAGPTAPGPNGSAHSLRGLPRLVTPTLPERLLQAGQERGEETPRTGASSARATAGGRTVDDSEDIWRAHPLPDPLVCTLICLCAHLLLPFWF